jgi:biotin carboxylase
VGGRPAPIAGAKELGIDVVLVHQEGQYEPDILAHCERVVHAPLADGDAIVEVLRPLHAERPFDRIITTSEPFGISTGHAVDAFGLPGVGEAVARALKDKSRTRELLEKHDVSPVRHRVVRGVDETVAFLTEIGGRVVVKPIAGAASRHIFPVADPADARRAWARLHEVGITSALAEEFLTGPVVSVESFSSGGRHVPIGFSEYQVNERFVEWAVTTPSRLAQPYLPELRDLTVRLLDAVGLPEGPTHSEFVLTPDGPRVLESHARLGGHALPHLVRRTYGPDFARMMLTVPLGIEELPAEPPEPVGGASIRFFTPPPGRVVSVDIDPGLDAVVRRIPPGESTDVYLPYLDELRDAEVGVVVAKNPGDVVPPLLALSDCSCGYVIASGRDAAEAEERCATVAAQVRFVVEELT